MTANFGGTAHQLFWPTVSVWMFPISMKWLNILMFLIGYTFNLNYYYVCEGNKLYSLKTDILTISPEIPTFSQGIAFSIHNKQFLFSPQMYFFHLRQLFNLFWWIIYCNCISCCFSSHMHTRANSGDSVTLTTRKCFH